MRNREPARRTPASRRVGATPATGPLSATPRACRPYRAQTKGKVERPVRYLRGNFVYGRTFLHDADLDAQRQRWLDRVANIRVHGTTGARPLERFEREERFLLQPLASRQGLIIGRYVVGQPLYTAYRRCKLSHCP